MARARTKPKLRFFQLDIDFDHERVPRSAWGSVVLTFVGQPKVLYFNLNVDRQWVVRNVPVLSREGAGVRQQTWFSFPLGDCEGERVRRLGYGASLTPQIVARPPVIANDARVSPRPYTLRQGIRGPGIRPKQPVPIEGAKAQGPKLAHRNFPNQPCRRNECVPAAISNSLRFLNDKHGLNMPAGDTSIDALKRPTGWSRRGGCPDGWEDGKKAYCTAKNLPIETTVPNQPGQYANRIAEAIRNGCDVEIIANGHCAAVTGIQRLANGRYSLDLTHDPRQRGRAGDGVTETVTYNPNTNTVLDGTPWIAGERLRLVVIECPKQEG